MTYIAQFRNLHENDNDAMHCSAYGPGLVEGVVGNPGLFTVLTAGRGKLEVKVVGPKNDAKVDVKKNADGSYNVSYDPKEPGTYLVHVTLDKNHIPGSIFRVVVLEEESLGGEGKVRVFFSSTSSTEKGRQDFFALQRLLTTKEIHLRPDFEPWVAVDVLTKDDRDAVFRRAGTKNLPIVFIDDKYTGDFDVIEALDKAGRLDKLLGAMTEKYAAEAKQQKSSAGASSNAPVAGASDKKSNAPAGVTRTPSTKAGAAAGAGAGGADKAKFCTGCGVKVTAAFCSGCGAKQ